MQSGTAYGKGGRGEGPFTCKNGSAELRPFAKCGKRTPGEGTKGFPTIRAKMWGGAQGYSGGSSVGKMFSTGETLFKARKSANCGYSSNPNRRVEEIP